MASERELKRRPPDHGVGLEMVHAVIALGGGTPAGGDTQVLTSRYLDTRERELELSQIGLRARGNRDQTQARWTVKIGATPDLRGISEAAEFEMDGCWQTLPPTLVVALRCVGVQGRLLEIARFKTLRERWLVDLEGVELEVCLDSVTVDSPQAFSFVELEVEAPERGILDLVIDELERRFPSVGPSPQSKLATALMSVPRLRPAEGPIRARAGDLGVRLGQLLDAVEEQPTPWASSTQGCQRC
ncbi:CYTH domain-containing protein [Ferrimicrobium sp.]|uniref:CYTH domain-containing protein n=1 Tax=Ferrimicrobium sp. TaxID=2926050 RepID=UPI0026383CDD|nr:CYTH domain-containing protein [Ferrimicrobium sp.]